MVLEPVFERFPTLETARFLLRPVRLDDDSLMLRYLSDPEATRYIDFQATSLRWARSHIKNTQRRYRDREWLRWAIERKSDQLFLGMCGFHNFGGGYRAEVGYELGREHWNQGVITEVLGSVLPFGFTTLGLHRIQAWSCTENHASNRVLVKAGFTLEGRLRDFTYIPHRETYEDVFLYGLLRSDPGWRKTPTGIQV